MNGVCLTLFLVGLLNVSISCSVEQEFIKQQKEKKFYPSCQQCAELKGDNVILTNELISLATRVQKKQLTGFSDCVNGNGTSKKQRAAEYAKDAQNKDTLQELIQQLRAMD